MPSLQWLKKEFHYGYDSGNILSLIPDRTRFSEERKIGGSYRKVFLKGLAHHLRPNYKVVELGPGRGSWTRAILKHIPEGELHTVDFQDVSKWLRPEKYNGRLVCHKAEDCSYSDLTDNYFDLFFSFGALCHNNAEHIGEILKNKLPKVRPGGIAWHQYGDWKKLNAYGWDNKCGIPVEFKTQENNEIWWPRNDQETMRKVASEAGWIVDSVDLNLVKRDSIMLLRKPE